MEKENILIGRNTVREAIKSGRSIDAVFVAKDSRDGSLREILALAKKQGIVVKETVKSKLDELSMPCLLYTSKRWPQGNLSRA